MVFITRNACWSLICQHILLTRQFSITVPAAMEGRNFDISYVTVEFVVPEVIGMPIFAHCFGVGS